MALDADELQYERGYGPCMDAGRAGQVFIIDDMRSEQRWPDYAQHAAAHGVLSSLSVPLPFQGAAIGALNTYAGRPHVIDDHDVELAEEVAAWVAIAIGNAEAAARTSEDLTQLRSAMMSRACIEQAKGILMERHKIKEDEAFTILTTPPNEPTPSCATWPPSSSGPAQCPVPTDTSAALGDHDRGHLAVDLYLQRLPHPAAGDGPPLRRISRRLAGTRVCASGSPRAERLLGSDRRQTDRTGNPAWVERTAANRVEV